MNVLMWCKTQIVCLLILGYVGIQFIREGNQLNRLTKRSNCNHVFDGFFIITEVAVLFDGITACTVNLLDVVPRYVNLLVHFGMFISYEIYVMLLFSYWISATVGIPKKRWTRIVYLLPGRRFLCVQELWQWLMCLMRCHRNGVIGMPCRLRIAFRLL